MENGTSIFADKFYEMNPEFEDLLGEGIHLQNGMIVLIEDSMARADMSSGSRYEAERAREVNRWCEVTQLSITKRYEHNDMGYAVGETSPLISFVAIYADGTKKKRHYDSSFAWIVKLDSVPKCTNPECLQEGNCALNEILVRDCVVGS